MISICDIRRKKVVVAEGFLIILQLIYNTEDDVNCWKLLSRWHVALP